MRFAAKRLTRSDLTLFEAQFRRQNAGNQKSINLNRSVFVDLLFPGAPLLSKGLAKKFFVSLRVFGPDGNTNAHQLTRKVIAAGENQKNWRLNGETIRDPDGEPSRYDRLAEGDYVIFGFEGDHVPDAIDLIVVSQTAPADIRLHAALNGVFGPRVMDVLDDAAMATLVGTVLPGHALAELADPEVELEIEEAALGSSDAVRRLRRRSVRRQSAEDLEAAKRRAEAVGRNGETLVAGYLRQRQAAGKIDGFVWVSQVNAVNPWDFTLRLSDATERRLEVKSTSGPHGRGIHVSQAEIEAAAEEGVPRTEIWRVSELDETGGVLRRSTNFRVLARHVSELCQDFGAGLVPDGWTVDPDRLNWGEAKTLRFDDDPEE